MITDIVQIDEAVEYVLGHEMYLQLTRECFRKKEGENVAALHIVAKSPVEAIKLLQIESVVVSQLLPSRLVVFFKNRSMKMSELKMMSESLPATLNYNIGLCFERPDEGDTEIWLFAYFPIP